MSKINLDITDRLDITCRRGDTFELNLTLKDSSGSALPLLTDDYTFLMQVRSTRASSTQRLDPILRATTSSSSGGGGESDDDNSITDGIFIGSTEQGVKGPVNFSFLNKDDLGNVTVFLSAQDMRKVRPGRYKYDFQYSVGDTQRTILEGRFVINDDVSKSI